MHVLVALFLLTSTHVISQSDQTIIWCPSGIRKIDPAYRIQDMPEKMNRLELDSTNQDSSKSTKQNDKTLIVSLPYTNALYTGFDNLIQIGHTRALIKQYEIQCEGCDTLYPAKNSFENSWIIRSNNTEKITLRALNKKGKIMGTSEIQVLPLPTPTVYIDGLSAQLTLTSIPNQIGLKYDKTIPLSVNFLVTGWEININDIEKFRGSGRSLSQKVRDFMESEKLGTMVIHLKYFDPTGVSHEMKEIFEFNLD